MGSSSITFVFMVGIFLRKLGTPDTQLGSADPMVTHLATAFVCWTLWLGLVTGEGPRWRPERGGVNGSR